MVINRTYGNTDMLWRITAGRLSYSSRLRSAMEGKLRTMIATFAGVMALAAISSYAAPIPPAKTPQTELGASRSIELAAQGCGYGYKRTQWQDEWGRWHWGRCVPKTWGSLSRHQFSQ